jgi:uncharacterized protein YbaR (Trm112 family)
LTRLRLAFILSGVDLSAEAPMFKAELLEILVCPKCKDRLVLEPNGEALRCERCKLRYLVQDDIPNMLIEDAVPF